MLLMMKKKKNKKQMSFAFVSSSTSSSSSYLLSFFFVCVELKKYLPLSLNRTKIINNFKRARKETIFLRRRHRPRDVLAFATTMRDLFKRAMVKRERKKD